MAARALTLQGYWRCTSCHGREVLDKMLLEIGGRMQIHRLICERCGAVSHYDRHLTRAQEPTASVNGMFWWIRDDEELTRPQKRDTEEEATYGRRRSDVGSQAHHQA